MVQFSHNCTAEYLMGFIYITKVFVTLLQFLFSFHFACYGQPPRLGLASIGHLTDGQFWWSSFLFFYLFGFNSGEKIWHFGCCFINVSKYSISWMWARISVKRQKGKKEIIVNTLKDYSCGPFITKELKTYRTFLAFIIRKSLFFCVPI